MRRSPSIAQAALYRLIRRSCELASVRALPQSIRGVPAQVQHQARDAYKLFKQDPYYPSLRFKQVHPSKPIYSVRINDDYRALGIRDRGDIVWFWIGGHEEYDKLVAQL